MGSSVAGKDIGLAVDLADELDVPIPMGLQTQSLIESCRDNGFADEDVLAKGKALEEQTDFVVRGMSPDVG